MTTTRFIQLGDKRFTEKLRAWGRELRAPLNRADASLKEVEAALEDSESYEHLIDAIVSIEQATADGKNEITLNPIESFYSTDSNGIPVLILKENKISISFKEISGVWVAFNFRDRRKITTV